MRRRFHVPLASSSSLSLLVLVNAISFLTGCSSGFTVKDPGYYAAISAASSSIRLNQQMQIVNNQKASGVPLTFSVNNVAGGNAQVGTIDSNGLYTAPATIPTTNNTPSNAVTITSVATSNSSYPPGTLTLSVLNPIPVLNAVTPTPLAEGMSQVTVNGSQFVYGAQISWNGAPVQTTYVSATQVVATIAAPNPGTFPLLVGNPDPGAANSATANVLVAPGQVAFQVQPQTGVDVRVSNSISFNLTITGTNNTGVTLAVTGSGGSSPTVVGSAVSNSDGSITYTAPAVVPTPNVVQMTITSVDNPTVSYTQDIAVLNPIPILSTGPASLNVGSNAITLGGQNFIAGAHVLVNGAEVPANVSSGTSLTATISPTQQGTVDLQVLNPVPGPAASADLVVQVGTPPSVVSLEDASRFLQQATFGATEADMNMIAENGYQAWLNQQLCVNSPTVTCPIQQTLLEPSVEQAVLLNNPACTAANAATCYQAMFLQNDANENLVQNAFWQNALSAPDELRQRVQYALQEIFVISGTNNAVASMPRGEANYYDLLGADAFTNFRQLLNDVTLNPMMGQWLNMLGNDKGNPPTTDPDENYAREVMQLFTIGLYKLNPDGSQILDANGNPEPTYTNTDVMGLASALTGFSWQIPGDTTEQGWSNCCVYATPPQNGNLGKGQELLQMIPYPDHHSTGNVSYLTYSGTLSDPNTDLQNVLDTILAQQNVAPFFCKQMIEHLVTSNPSPAYITHCSGAFTSGTYTTTLPGAAGTYSGGTKAGDMQAVIAAILLDPEARTGASSIATPTQYGKVREALLRYTEWARAFSAQSRTGGYWLNSTEDPIYGLGQMTMRSPTVFNWFAPGYVPSGYPEWPTTPVLVGPEFQMTNVTTVVGFLNYMQGAVGANATSGPDVFASYDTELGLAQSPSAQTPTDLVDRVNLLLMAGQMSSQLQGDILTAVESITIPTTGDQNAINAALAARVQTAVYLTLASPDFTAQQ
jgi:uncharacterized protein (DUF1800 family)